MPDGHERFSENAEKKFEMACGIVLTFLAAMLALTDLAAGRAEGEQNYAENEKVSAYSWYQSKSIKQTLVEGQAGLLRALVESGSIQAAQTDAVNLLLSSLEREAVRYGREKREILEGSAAVGEENWAQDINGELGRVTGAMEWERQERALDNVGDIFDVAILFLQICLVLGAVSLVFQQRRPRIVFFFGMCLLGLAGLCMSAYGYWRFCQIL